MSRARFGLLFALLGTMAIWGCTQSPTPPQATKNTRMQEEIQSLCAVRDQLRLDLRTVQDERDRLTEEVLKLRPLLKEREELQQQLAARTAERDQGMVQLDQIRKGVRALLEQVEACMPVSPDAIGAAASPSAGKS